MNFDMPKIFDFNSGELVELNHLCDTFNIPRRTAFLYLKALHIKPVYFGSEVFFSLPSFNRIMYVLTKPGSPGFLFPGSKGKNTKSLRDSGYLVEVTDEIIEQAMRPETLAEMAAAAGKDPSLLRKFASYRNKPERKKECLE
jgi:hypothetical protein